MPTINEYTLFLGDVCLGKTLGGATITNNDINYNVRPEDVSYVGKSNILALEGDIKFENGKYFQYNGGCWDLIPNNRFEIVRKNPSNYRYGNETKLIKPIPATKVVKLTLAKRIWRLLFG